jgi:hypothetical protein
MRLPDNPTKVEYQQLLNETIDIFRIQSKNEDDELSRIILDQLLDIKDNVVELGVLTEWDEINERYTLGGLAVNNFEEKDELGQRLKDVFGGAMEYEKMK